VISNGYFIDQNSSGYGPAYACNDTINAQWCCATCQYAAQSQKPHYDCLTTVDNTSFVGTSKYCYTCDDTPNGGVDACATCTFTAGGSIAVCTSCHTNHYFLSTTDNRCYECQNTTKGGWEGCQTCHLSGSTVVCDTVISDYFFIESGVSYPCTHRTMGKSCCARCNYTTSQSPNYQCLATTDNNTFINTYLQCFACSDTGNQCLK
jgi:hypothetical protein